MFKNQKSLLITALGLFGVTLLSSVINISYDVENHKLESSIEQLSEDKANLRASYLSETSLHKLSSRAEDMDMEQASSETIQKVSIKREKIKRRKLISQAHKQKKLQPRVSISGY